MTAGQLPGRVLTRNATDYAWRQLAARAGLAPKDYTAVRLSYADPTPGGPGDRRAHRVTVIPCRPGAFEAIIRDDAPAPRALAAGAAVPTGSDLPLGLDIPVLFWSEGCEDGSKPFAEQRADGSVVFHADILAAAFYMLSRWEETAVKAQDRHGRFPDSAGIAHRFGFFDRPLVDEYALVLREWLKLLMPGWQPAAGRFAVRLSHDIDSLREVQDYPRFLRRALRSAGGDLLRRRKPGRAAETMQELSRTTAEVLFPGTARRMRAVRALAALASERGLASSFYFMAALPGRFDAGYDPGSRAARHCMSELESRGFDIGLHAGYDSFDRPDRLAAEKSRLERALGHEIESVRQHWLRFRVPDTWRHQERAGLKFDATMSYSEHEGFRCGTCHPFRPFDCAADRELDLLELPLIAKDSTLRHYRGLAPTEAESLALKLARRCRAVEGTFTLLWHNTFLDPGREEWVEPYARILRGLAGLADGPGA